MWGAQYGEESFVGVWGSYGEAKAVLGDGDDYGIKAIRVEDTVTFPAQKVRGPG